VADNIGNGGYAVGAEREDWRSLDLGALRCRVWRDEALVHDAPGGHPQGDPLAPIRALKTAPIDRIGGLRAGQIVTTGTLCGVMPIAGPCRIRAELEGFGPVSLTLTD
jgi:2-keto-4-pentenoate hydratase